MLRSFTFALACLLSVAASTAQAAVLGNYLTFDGPVHLTLNGAGNPFQGGGEDFLQDDSVSAYADRGTAGFGSSDVIWGVLTLSDIDSSGQPSLPVANPNQIAIVFAVKVDGAAPGGAFANLPVGNAADPLDLRNLLAGSPAIGHINDNTIAVILSSNQADLASEDPLNFTTANFTANFASGIWGYELTADLIPATDDFFHFLGDLTGGLDSAALTITDSIYGPPGLWLPVDVKDFGGGIHLGSITLDRGRVDPASAEQQANGWFFRDTSDLFVNPVPEPGSMAIFGLIGAAGLLRARRNKK